MLSSVFSKSIKQIRQINPVKSLVRQFKTMNLKKKPSHGGMDKPFSGIPRPCPGNPNPKPSK